MNPVSPASTVTSPSINAAKYGEPGLDISGIGVAAGVLHQDHRRRELSSYGKPTLGSQIRSLRQTAPSAESGEDIALMRCSHAPTYSEPAPRQTAVSSVLIPQE